MDFTRLLNQTAVYWGSPSYDGYSKRTFATPVEVSVRWEDKQELFTDSQGKEKLPGSLGRVLRTFLYSNLKLTYIMGISEVFQA